MGLQTLNDGYEQTTRPMCPFSIKQVDGSVISGEAPSVGAAPCLGEACMAYTRVTDPAGKPVGGDCRLCLQPQVLNNIAGQLAALTQTLAGKQKEEASNG